MPTELNLSTNDNITWRVTFAGNTDPDESFPAPADGLNSLKDGVYDLNIDAAKVHPVGSPQIDAVTNSTTTFHRLFGDTDETVTLPGGVENRDFMAIISIADNIILRGAFNNPANYKPFLDFDGDQIINISDNFQFRSRFNKPLSWSV